MTLYAAVYCHGVPNTLLIRAVMQVTHTQPRLKQNEVTSDVVESERTVLTHVYVTTRAHWHGYPRPWLGLILIAGPLSAPAFAAIFISSVDAGHTP